MKLVSGLVLLTLGIAAEALAGVGVWTTNGPPGGAHGVIADARTPGAIYAGSLNGIFESTDNGATWLATGLAGQYTNPLATAPPATVYVSAVPAFSNGPGTPGVFRSLDGGATWSIMAQDVFAELCILVVDPFSSNTLFRTVNVNGGSEILRSTDGGTTWAEADAGLGLDHALVTAFIADPNAVGTLYAATEPVQRVSGAIPTLFKTMDSGATWVALASDLGFPLTLAIDPTTSSTLYAGRPPSLNPLLPGGDLFKSTDGGGTFLPVTNGLTNTNILAICIDPRHPNRVYVAMGYGGVFASTDGGASWQPMNNGLTDQNVLGLAIDSTGTHLHAAAQSGVFDYEINADCFTATTLCLNNNRFTVTATFQATPEAPSAPSTAVPLTNDTGNFWFFDPTNIELVVKALTECTINGNYWVFAGGLTDVGVELKVTDTLTGAIKSYTNPLGTPFQPIQDSSAFPCP
jgi:hypothetical protein